MEKKIHELSTQSELIWSNMIQLLKRADLHKKTHHIIMQLAWFKAVFKEIPCWSSFPWESFRWVNPSLMIPFICAVYDHANVWLELVL